MSNLGALLFERGETGVVSIDSSGQVLRANAAMLRLLGSPGEATTLLFNVFELPTIPPALRKECRESLVSGRVHEAQFEYTSMHGKRTHVRMVSIPVMFEEQFIGGCIQLFDVSASKAAEDQLRRTSKMESLSLLASSLAHDLNNVFTALVGYSSLLRKPGGLPPSRHAHALEMIEKASGSGARLVENLLSFTSERTAHLPTCSFGDACRQAVALFSCGLPPEIQVECRFEAPDVRIRGSANKIEHLIINLALNARDAILPRPGAVRFTSRLVDTYPPDCLLRVTARGRFVELVVEDTGSGIRPENVPRIFDPYFSTKAPGRGTGLGLSSVWGILKELGGTIRVSSTQGVGTLFSVYLPLATEEDDGTHAELPPFGEAFGRGQRVLLVESDSDLGTLLVWVLLRNGYKVLHCASTLQAEGILQNSVHGIDGVVAEDQGLGSSCERFQQKVAASGLPMLRLTSRPAPLDARSPATLQKPFRPEQLLDAVSNLFAHHTAQKTKP